MPEDFKPKLDDFTAKVVADPAKPQETLLLQGFLGASSQPDHTRVYSDMSLTSYVDVANADIVHAEPMPKDQSPLGGSYLWVKKEAEVAPAVPAGTVTAKAKFLEGPIAAQATGATGAPSIQRPITIPVYACHPSILIAACSPSRLFVRCPTAPVACTIAVSAQGPCTIPDPTIYETQPQAAGQFQAAAAVAGGGHPIELPTTTVIQTHTPICQPIHFSVANVCPSVPCTITRVGPECPVHTTVCPQQAASVACAVQGAPQAAALAPALGPQQLVTALPIGLCPTHLCPSVNDYHCPSVSGYDCPTVNNYHCPSVAGYECPSVNQYHCPSVAGYDCPSVNNYHCPSIAGYKCPSVFPPICPSIEQHCPRTAFVDCQTSPKVLC